MSDETRAPAEEPEAELTEEMLPDCHKNRLWAFAKAHDLVEPDEWPGIEREDLVTRIRAFLSGASLPEIPDRLRWDGRPSPARIPGVGILRRGDVVERSSLGDRRMRLVMGIPGFVEVGD